MPLMGFSEQKHVSLIMNGTKRQTTRKPRKNPITVNDILYCYFKPRMKRGTCDNCVNPDCNNSNYNNFTTTLVMCQDWINKFGNANITAVVRVGRTTLSFDKWYDHEKEEWAKADGFENFQEADEWFRMVHGDNWQNQEWDIIYFEGDWLRERK